MMVAIQGGPFNFESEADEFIQQTYSSWHPAGYGTSLTKRQLSNGQWLVNGSRSDSCD